jgi:hypothetical protein
MPRKAKTDKNAPGASAQVPGQGHNSDLSDDERRALAFQHRDKYASALAKKKAADAGFKNVCKTAKSEMGDGAVDVIKALIALEEPEGEEAIREKLQLQADALRWAGVPLGTQIDFDLREPDRMPAVDRAFEEGKRMSAEGRPAKPEYDPSTPQYRAFMDGYAEDQSRLVSQLGRGNRENSEAP